ncbi:MAG: hypothetical protein WCS75_05625 [Sphingomonas sp.]|jgi:hypothetical protein|uniref:hypothetical protein n=1 Tax=Sphingomonas sp. TaxID=28214 RepID=UPI0035641CBE
MSKVGDKSQLDFDLSGSHLRSDALPQASQALVIPFIDATTLQVRRDALRRVASSGIFQIPSALRRD